MPYKFLEHTADVLFEAEGKDFKEALEEAAKALSAAVAEGVEKKEEFEFEEKAANLGELAVATLSHLLSESEVRELLPGGLQVVEFEEKPGESRVKVKAWAGSGKQKTIIKGVTYGMLKAEKFEGGFRLRILLDI